MARPPMTPFTVARAAGAWRPRSNETTCRPAPTNARGPSCAALVVDAAALFGDGGPEALRRALDATWTAVRATANAAFITADAGKVVLVGPRPTAGDHAVALRAALENLARVSSIEWAR